MATEVDLVTRRPRTPNDQYTRLSEEQIRNINKVQYSDRSIIISGIFKETGEAFSFNCLKGCQSCATVFFPVLSPFGIELNFELNSNITAFTSTCQNTLWSNNRIGGVGGE